MTELRPSTMRTQDALYGLLGVVLVLIVVLSIGLFTINEAQASTCSELVSSGAMESSEGWTARTNGDYSLFSDYLVRSGNQAAYLAGVDDAEDSLAHSLTLPAGAEITLTFWWQVHTEERSSGWDGLSVLAADQSGAPLKVLFSASDLEAGYSWNRATADLSEFAGESIHLQFKAQTDGSLPTDFFVDDVSVSACTASEDTSPRLFLPFTSR